MGHNIELLRKQEKNSRKPSENLTMYSQKALPCFAENNQKRYRNRNNKFSIENKSGHTLKINWDDVSYVDVKGQVGRVMHSGVKYTDRNSSQPATSVPKGANISDILLPTENVYYVSGQYGGWRETYLIPCVYKTPEDFKSEAPSLV